MVARVIMLQIFSERDDACSPTLCGGYVNSQVAQIAYKGGVASAAAALVGVVVVVVILLIVLVEPSFGLRIQLLLIPYLASAALPTRRALVAELGAASTRDVVAPKGELDYCAAARTPLPLVLLEVVDHGGAVVLLLVARRVPWMGRLRAGRADENMAGWAGHLAFECLHWSEEYGTHRVGAVSTIFRWGVVFDRLLFKVLPNTGGY